MWIFIPLVALAAKAVYSAVTDNSEEENRERRSAQARARTWEREQEQARAQETERARRRKAAQDDVVTDARLHVTGFFAQQDALTVPAADAGNFSLPELKRFAQQDVPDHRQALLAHLSTLVPGTAIRAAQCRQEARIASLAQEIVALQRLQSAFPQGASA